MLKRVLFFILLIGIFSPVHGQERYFDPMFSVRTTYTIPYGQADFGRGKLKPLFLDLYQPMNDSLKKRPVIVFAHGGGFVFGDKNNYSAETICTRLAQMGYVCVSINYRLGFEKKGTTEERAQRTMLKAVHDMKAAIRYLRKTADSVNHIGIDPNLIIAAGSSAGAITALHVAYLDSIEFENTLNSGVEIPGGLEGLNGSEGQLSSVQGVINLCGAIGDTSYIDESIPCLNMHGTEDPMVPFGYSKIKFHIPFIAKVPEAQVYGSSMIVEHLNKTGISHGYQWFKNQGHCPYDKILDRKRYPMNMDLTINTIRNFLFNTYWNNGPGKTDLSTNHASDLAFEQKGSVWNIYPIDKNVKRVKLIVQTLDRKVVKKKSVRKKLKSFETNITLKPGDYRVTIVFNDFTKTYYFSVS